LLLDVLEGRIEPARVLDRTVGLEDVPGSYKAMADREAIKVMVRPWPAAIPSSPLMENRSSTAEPTREGMLSQRPQALVAALAYLQAADPVLAKVIDENPAFDLRVWNARSIRIGS
jgi:hypothetical protein